jgi:L-seryl-tRNA(Ser) seleniumtransferase
LTDDTSDNALRRADLLRSLPSVHRLLEHLGDLQHEPARRACQQVVESERQSILQGETTEAVPLERLLERCRAAAAALRMPSLRRVLNGTGVLLHTNLGRAVLAEEAIEAVQTALGGYTNLELDLKTGQRGSRQAHLTGLLTDLTGAEDALVVNNCAAAALLVLSALCRGREAVVSRGELVEIGGGFRVPEVMAESGAVLREVGTTNRTHLKDYERALGPQTGMIVKVHRSNFALLGHVAEVGLEELAKLGRGAGVPLYYDAGSGGLEPLHRLQPTLREIVAAGPDLVTSSGDKMLGGPQAGLILGRRPLLAKLKSHPLARAMRADKATVGALEATLRMVRDGRGEELPLCAQVRASVESLTTAGRALLEGMAFRRLQLDLVPSEAQLGGGSDPRATLPSIAISLAATGASADELRRLLLEGWPPVLARVAEDRCLVDLRSILPKELSQLARCLQDLEARLPVEPDG